MMARSISVQILACFLCPIIFVVALDTLPDPPAVKPQGGQNNSVSQPVYNPAVAKENRALDCLPSGARLQANFISNGQGFEMGRPASEPLVRQATDTSPPRLS